MTSNQRCAIAANSSGCSPHQASIDGSRLTEPGNRISRLTSPPALGVVQELADDLHVLRRLGPVRGMRAVLEHLHLRAWNSALKIRHGLRRCFITTAGQEEHGQ